MTNIFNSADICRRNGWQVGDCLIAGDTPIVVRITAIGEEQVLVRRVKPYPADEAVMNLGMRKWTRVQLADV